MNLGNAGEREFDLDAVGIEESTLVGLDDLKIKGSISKNLRRSFELQVKSSEIPSANDQRKNEYEEPCDSKGDEGSINF